MELTRGTVRVALADLEEDSSTLWLEVSSVVDGPEEGEDPPDSFYEEDGIWWCTHSCPTAVLKDTPPDVLREALQAMLAWLAGDPELTPVDQDVAGSIALIQLPQHLGKDSPFLDPSSPWYPDPDEWTDSMP